MKTLEEVSNSKLRGGFYTPDPLVEVCLDRISELCGLTSEISILEPSVGDGAFLRRLAFHPLLPHVQSFLGIEIDEREAQKCREQAWNVPFDTTILTMSALDWAVTTDSRFDVVIGNPPFVRYQFVSKGDIDAIEQLGCRMGLAFRGVSNLWIPILLGALSRLRVDGAMALVVPAEIFTGLSAGDARAWLLSNFTDLRIDMFEPGSFPDVLQEVVVISGRRIAERKVGAHAQVKTRFVEHAGNGHAVHWMHTLPNSTQSWTRFLLTPVQLEAVATAESLSAVYQFGNVAKLEVSIVTGANDFFSVASEELEQYGLEPWAVPLLPRIRHALGLVYTTKDHHATAAEGAKAWLLNFSETLPDPKGAKGASRYLKLGEKQNLHKRYKTSIREPWYRVPSVWADMLMLSKRSHWFPRLVYNEAGVVTTDTIYRGHMLPLFEQQGFDLVAAFHNSLTLLTAELQGRSFGGGVLELVPSEIARLAVPLLPGFSQFVPKLDAIAKTAMSEFEEQNRLVDETDALLTDQFNLFTKDLLAHLREARLMLLRRRLSRN